MNMEEQLRAVVNTATTDAGLWHNIVHGDDTRTVETENGAVPSVAKQLKDIKNAIMGGVVDIISVAESARDEAIVAKEQADIIKNQTQGICDEVLSPRDETETFKNLSQTTFNNIATATSTAITNIQNETATQIENVQSCADEQIELAKAEANRAKSYADNMETQEQSVYQNVKTLENGNIGLEDKIALYQITSELTDISITIDTHLLTKTGRILTFELLIKVIVPKNILFDNIQLTWLGGDVPDLSETGFHLLVFRSFDDGLTWIGNKQGKF